MLALRFEFVAGHFHANPWDRGTNEGDTEWPPSPWRLLRAIVAGWYRSGAEDRETLIAVIDKLAEPPLFDLPFSSAGHTRHYVPLGGLKGGNPERTLMLDSFIALDGDDVHRTHAFAIWPNVSLAASERALLERCCAMIRYLGRAESWCEVSCVDEVTTGSERYRVDLASPGEADRDGSFVRRLAAGPSLRGAGLLRAIGELTADMRRARRVLPQGASWIEYRLPPAFGWVEEQVRRRDLERTTFPPSVLRFALDAENGVLPPVTATVGVAETMRQAVIKRFSTMQGTPTPRRLAGKDEDGGARQAGHDHPFFLPADLSGRGLIDTVDVWLPTGCTHDEFRALTGVTAIWDPVVLKGRFAITYLGRVDTVVAKAWLTVTPVVLDRFPKQRGPGKSLLIDAPQDQLARALERRGLPQASVDVWLPGQTIAHPRGGRTRLDAFRRSRLGEHTLHPVVGATLTFSEPVSGPLVLGRLAHFGLGQFAPRP